MYDPTLGTRFKEPSAPEPDSFQAEGPWDSLSVTDFGERTDESFHLVNQIMEIFRRERSRKNKVEQLSRQTWELYHRYYAEDEEKDDWQSKRAFPFVFMLTERWVSNLCRLLEDNPKWFTVEALIPGQQVFLNLCKLLVQTQFAHPMICWNEKWAEINRSGLLSSHVAVMATVEEMGGKSFNDSLDGLDLTSEESLYDLIGLFKDDGGDSSVSDVPFDYQGGLPKVNIEVLDSAHFWKDTRNVKSGPKYRIWETYISSGDFLDMAPKLGYDLDACKRAIIRGRNPESFDNRDDFQQNLGGRMEDEVRTMVVLTHFEGTLPDYMTGYNEFRDHYCVVANGQELVLEPKPIPYWDKGTAVIDTPFIKVNNSPYGKSPVSENLDAFIVRHQQINSLLDYFNRSLNCPYAYDPDRIHQDEGSLDSLYPGQLIQVTSPAGNANPAISPIANVDLPQGFWQFMQFFQSNYSEWSGMGQEQNGMSMPRGRHTARELESRASNNNNFIVSIYRGLEDRMLQPLVRNVFLRTLQYTPTKQWAAWVVANIPRIIPKNTPEELKQKWKQQLMECAKWTPQQRFQRLGGVFRFTVRIFSSLLERQAAIEQSTFFLQVVSRIPQALQKIRLETILAKIVEAFGWDPEELLTLDVITEPEQELELLRALTEKGIEALEEPMQAMNELSMMGDLFGGMGSDLFGSQPRGDLSPQPESASVMQSGSPAPGTGFPRQVSPNPVNPRF